MRDLCRSALATARAASIVFFATGPAQAHAFGARYDLPLPLELYLAGAGGAVALSFVIMALVFRGRPTDADRLRADLLRYRPIQILFHPAIIGAIQSISVGLFLLVLVTGFFGTQETLENFGPTFIWIIWWVGLAYVAALAGNLWPAINPWSILFVGLESLFRRFRPQRQLNLELAYQSRFGVWPAVVLFGLFAWVEMFSGAAKVPETLAAFILIYSAITWMGMAAFGRSVWLAHGEAFSLAFGVLGRFAPIGRPERDSPDGHPVHWYLRPYASGLIVARPCSPSMTVFVLLMLSTVTFDGLRETPLPASLVQWIALQPLLYPFLLELHNLGVDFPVLLETAMFVLLPLVFFLVYRGFSWLAKLAVDGERSVTEISGLFIFSLVPIAIAYHLAHYLSYLLIAGQRIVPLASDPFGIGWNLFGTTDYGVNIGIVGAKFTWYTAVVAIVVGHVFAVGVAHFVALRSFQTVRAALRSQYPFLALMIAYTMVSLWILSQPIVESSSPSSLRAPSDTVSLAPFEFREYCLEIASPEAIQYEFQSDGPVEFNIHYHDGFTIKFPVRLEGISVGADEFVAEVQQPYCLMWTNPSMARTSLKYRIIGP